MRLWIEDDRLRFSAPRGALDGDLRAELARRKTEILGFLQRAEGVAGSKVAPLNSSPSAS